MYLWHSSAAAITIVLASALQQQEQATHRHGKTTSTPPPDTRMHRAIPPGLMRAHVEHMLSSVEGASGTCSIVSHQIIVTHGFYDTIPGTA